MTTAVYILSPSDKIDAFAAKAREREFEARNVFVGAIEGDMRSVVFQDGSPYVLKQAIATKSDPMSSLKNLINSFGLFSSVYCLNSCPSAPCRQISMPRLPMEHAISQ